LQVELKDAPFDPCQELQDHQARLDQAGRFGATAVFIGSMRDFNDGERVTGLFLEHYPGMTERELQHICEEACRRWTVIDLLVIHRVGTIAVGEPIVLVAVWSAHRGDAFDACRAVMEELKRRAPFWKKEQLDQKERWVESNTSGYAERGAAKP